MSVIDVTKPERDISSDLGGRVSEHYYALLRRLQAVGDSASHHSPAFGITSCQARAGVTTVAANLALAAASVNPGRVLLVDANVSKPAIGKVFRTSAEAGLVDVLAGDKPAFDCVTETSWPNLTLMLAGRTQSGREPTYDASAIDEMLDTLKHVFQTIIFDLPPVHPLTNCYSLAGRLDGVLLVTVEGLDQQQGAEALQHLADVKANVLGAVYNKQRKQSGGHKRF